MKKKLMRYSKEVLVQYIMNEILFINFKNLDLIKDKLELDSIGSLQDQRQKLEKNFFDLVKKGQNTENTKKLEKILEEMGKTKNELKKVENRIERILLK